MMRIDEIISHHRLNVPNKIAIQFNKKNWTFSELDKAIHESSSYLQRHLNLKEGDRICYYGPNNPEQIRSQKSLVASFSDFFISQDNQIRKFLRTRVYEHSSIENERVRSMKIIEDIFSKLIKDIDLLPIKLRKKCDTPYSKISARVICDYIASMTDRSVVENHARLYDKNLLDHPGY